MKAGRCDGSAMRGSAKAFGLRALKRSSRRNSWCGENWMCCSFQKSSGGKVKSETMSSREKAIAVQAMVRFIKVLNLLKSEQSWNFKIINFLELSWAFKNFQELSWTFLKLSWIFMNFLRSHEVMKLCSFKAIALQWSTGVMRVSKIMKSQLFEFLRCSVAQVSLDSFF